VVESALFLQLLAVTGAALGVPGLPASLAALGRALLLGHGLLEALRFLSTSGT
jgi:hypothetical protein